MKLKQQQTPTASNRSSSLHSLTAILFAIICSLVARKIFIGQKAMHYVAKCKQQVDTNTLLANGAFREMAGKLQNDTLILMLNRHAVNMTMNWLCNTAHMVNVHDKVLVVAVDEHVTYQLRQHWPMLNVFHWDVPCLQDPFNFGEGPYQLFYYFRASLTAALLELNRSFWMIQQDTFWKRSLLDIDIAHNSDVVFDRLNDNKAKAIAGGHYYARPSTKSRQYFNDLSNELVKRYAPDNVLMTSNCYEKYPYCDYIPYSIITNWKWIFEDSAVMTNNDTERPYLIQFDGDTKLGGKLAKMRSMGFYFLKDNGQQCNASAVAMANAVVGSGHRTSTRSRSWANVQLIIYELLIELMAQTKFGSHILNGYILPHAHYFMITL